MHRVYRNSQMTRENQRFILILNSHSELHQIETTTSPYSFFGFSIFGPLNPVFWRGTMDTYASIFKKNTVPIAHIRTDSEPIANRSL
jgi:hypothetical protein